MKLVLIRHGESQWNQENRFTGWTDVDLSEKGISEAKEAGKTFKKAGYDFDLAYTSFLKRAIKTLDIILEETDQMWIPVEKTWRLNERHYGALQGLNKTETAQKYGENQVKIWRRSYDVLPPALEPSDPRNAAKEKKYSEVNPKDVPLTESLKETVARVIPLWEKELWPLIQNGKKVIIVAHGNSLRALVKYLDKISEQDIVELNIPTGIPLVYELDKNMRVLKKEYLGDQAKIQEQIAKVQAQGKK